MILKHILFKNFIVKTIKNKFNIVNIILFLKQLVILYIIYYTQSILNKQILIINHFSALNNHLKLVNVCTSNPYLNNKNLDNFVNNWQILKKQLLLLKWLIYLINLMNKNKIKLSFISTIKLFKKFIILKKNYWSIVNLNNPTYILIISKKFKNNLVKNYLKFTKQIFFITMSPAVSHLQYSTIISPNLASFKTVLELIITAHLQGKYYLIK